MGEYAIRNKKRGRYFRGEKNTEGKEPAFLYIRGNKPQKRFTAEYEHKFYP